MGFSKFFIDFKESACHVSGDGFKYGMIYYYTLIGISRGVEYKRNLKGLSS